MQDYSSLTGNSWCNIRLVAAHVSRGVTIVTAIIAALGVAAHAYCARADASPGLMHFNGAFRSDVGTWLSWAQPCDRNSSIWYTSDYYEDTSQLGQVIFPAQAQCQGASDDVPQVVNCGGAQGSCMKFRTGPDLNGSMWNRSQLAIGNELALRKWHNVEMKIMFPSSTVVPSSRVAIGGFFWQALVPGRTPAGIRGGLVLNNVDDGPLSWSFRTVHSKEELDGSFTPTWDTPSGGYIQPNQWIKFSLYYYVDPEAVSHLFLRVDNEPVVVWSGKQGVQHAPELGAVGPLPIDVKIGVYTAPVDTEVVVYMDDVSIRENSYPVHLVLPAIFR